MLRAAAICCMLLAGAAQAATFEQVRARFQSSEALLFDRHGAPLQSLRVDAEARRLRWIALPDISPALVRAVLAAEDQHFYAHAGIDWSALARAAWDGVFAPGRRTRGASTISMQLAAALDPALAPGRDGRTLAQKWRQLRAARALETEWSKPQILEAYLNLVSFRGELQGVDAAARGLFRKAPSGLNNSEAALLAVLIRAPNAARAGVVKRACALLRDSAMNASCNDVEWAALALDGAGRLAVADGAAPEVARRLLDADTRRADSSLDGALQRFVLGSVQQQLAGLRGRNVRDAAALVLDNASGEILAYVANAGGSAVDGVRALRQAGSTLKPFLYELALENRQLTAASVLEDAPLDIVTPGGLYIPQNYDRQFKGMVSVRTSLASSLNVPAVRTLLLTGTDAFHARLHRLGFDSLTRPADYYGYALALGAAEVSLLELTNAYRALANGGRWSAVRLGAEKNEPARAVMDQRASFIVADMLADPAARSLTFGLDSVLATRFWSAVKTGTSKDMRDNWCVGFSRRYTVGVWVGNFDGDPMWDVSGVSGAAPVWREVMDYLHRDAPGQAPAPPAGVVARQIEFSPALEQPRREWFLAGTESELIEVLPDARRTAKIRYPGNGVIVGIDPDMPARSQHLWFQAQAGEDLFWVLDGVPRGSAARHVAWQPVAGRHVLSLVDAQDRVIDSVRFEVRGSRR